MMLLVISARSRSGSTFSANVSAKECVAKELTILVRDIILVIRAIFRRSIIRGPDLAKGEGHIS